MADRARGRRPAAAGHRAHARETATSPRPTSSRTSSPTRSTTSTTSRRSSTLHREARRAAVPRPARRAAPHSRLTRCPFDASAPAGRGTAHEKVVAVRHSRRPSKLTVCLTSRNPSPGCRSPRCAAGRTRSRSHGAARADGCRSSPVLRSSLHPHRPAGREGSDSWVSQNGLDSRTPDADQRPTGRTAAAAASRAGGGWRLRPFRAHGGAGRPRRGPPAPPRRRRPAVWRIGSSAGPNTKLPMPCSTASIVSSSVHRSTVHCRNPSVPCSRIEPNML